jgi:glutamate-5-semialdehyde dehydrogenase
MPACITGLASGGAAAECVQLVPTSDRAAVGCMLSGMSEYLDVLVPRGGKSLVARVQPKRACPVIGHLEGNCHVYVEDAELAMARAIVLNAKLRRTGVCGAAETLLIDRAATTHLAPLVRDLLAAGCEVRGDERTCRQVDARVRAATRGGLVPRVPRRHHRGARGRGRRCGDRAHRQYGSAHTEAIVTQDAAAAERFLREVDSAIVLHNASTQFADGGEFGMGAEIGISTARFHARGPVGVQQLTSYKYVVRGTGQVRP